MVVPARSDPGRMGASGGNDCEAVAGEPGTLLLPVALQLDRAVAGQHEHEAIVPVPGHRVRLPSAHHSRLLLIPEDQLAFVFGTAKFFEGPEHRRASQGSPIKRYTFSIVAQYDSRADFASG